MQIIIRRSMTPLKPLRTYGPSAGLTTTRVGERRMSVGTAPHPTIAAASAGGPSRKTGRGGSTSGPLALEHGDLLPEREDLQGRVGVSAEENANCCQHCEQEIEHGSNRRYMT
jgi:hypothetical protein